ncbi:MAG TPA: hypothetical protein VJR89_29170 [Polyangiales bacterium]|nr:hypothetical protein [Polyangiales bacterium]
MRAFAKVLAWARRALAQLFAYREVSLPNARPVDPQPRRSRGQSALRPRAKPGLDRTMLGHGPLPQRPASVRAYPDDLLSSYEAQSRWSSDPHIAGSSTRAELRALCDQLYVLAANGCLVIRIASDAGGAASKSQISAQLAWSLAEFGRARVLLLEADFDDPCVHRAMRLDTPPFKGFSQQIHARTTRGERAPWSVARCTPCLAVLAEGRVRTPGLVHTEQFSTALAELRRCYDIIVVDGPAAGSAADTRALDGVSDGVVFAVGPNAGSSDALRRAAATFGDKALLWIVHSPDTTHAAGETAPNR